MSNVYMDDEKVITTVDNSKSESKIVMTSDKVELTIESIKKQNPFDDIKSSIIVSSNGLTVL